MTDQACVVGRIKRVTDQACVVGFVMGFISFTLCD